MSRKKNNSDPWLRKRQIFFPQIETKKVRKWRVLPILWLAFKKTSTVIGAVVIISSFFSLWILSSLLGEIDAVAEFTALPDEMVLYLEIDDDLPDQIGEADFSQPFVKNTRTLRNYVDALEQAAFDPRVKGVYVKLGDGSLSVAHAQEFREALAMFKNSGKFSYIYALDYDQGLSGYYLARAFDEVWMQPMGVVMLSGISAQVPYLRRVLDKIGVYPQIYKREEYKSAYDTFTEKEMPEASRRETEELVADIADVLSEDISKDKDITPKAFKALVDKGLYVDQESLEAGLIDVLDYEDVLIEKINERVTGDPKTEDQIYVDFDDYVTEMLGGQSYFSANHRIALVYAQGMIIDSSGDQPSFKGGGVAAADEISSVLLDIADDDNYDGVVLRIDSPGGSPVASETILRAVQKVQESGKNVTVSMGATAASGGYWIASSADQIFAMPSTLTGSIGVLGGKFSGAALWKKLEVNWDEVNWGDKAGMWSVHQPFSKSEAERINAMMDNVYTNFIARVAKGRDMSEAEVKEIAKGRVWSGKRALDIGLVDQLGGLNAALDYAAQQVGAMDRNEVFITILPQPLTPIEQLVLFLESQVKAGQALQIQAHLMQSLFWSQVGSIFEETGVLHNGAAVYEPGITTLSK